MRNHLDHFDGEESTASQENNARFAKAAKKLGYANHKFELGVGGVGNHALYTVGQSLLAQGRRFGEYNPDDGVIVHGVAIDTDKSALLSDKGRFLAQMGAKLVHLHVPNIEAHLHRLDLKRYITPGRARGSDDKGAGASPKDGITRMNVARRLGLRDGNGFYLSPPELFSIMVRNGLEEFPMYDGSVRIDGFAGISGGTGAAIRIAIADLIAAVCEWAPNLGIESNLYLSTIEAPKDTEGRNVPESLRKMNAFVQLLYTLGDQHARNTKLLDGSPVAPPTGSSAILVPQMVYLTTAGNAKNRAPSDRAYEPTQAVARFVADGQLLAPNATLASQIMNTRRGLEVKRDLLDEDRSQGGMFGVEDPFVLPEMALSAIGVSTIFPEDNIRELTMAKKRARVLAASGLHEDSDTEVSLSEEDNGVVEIAQDGAMPIDLDDAVIAAFNSPTITGIDVERPEDSVNRVQLAQQNLDNQVSDMRPEMERLIHAKTEEIAQTVTQKAAELLVKGLNVERAYLAGILTMINDFDGMVTAKGESHSANETDSVAALEMILDKVQNHQNIPWFYNLIFFMGVAQRRLAQKRSDAAITLNAYADAKVKGTIYGLFSTMLATKLREHVTQLLEANRQKEQNVRVLLTKLVPDPDLAHDGRTRFDVEAPVAVNVQDMIPGESAQLGSYSPEELAAYARSVVLTTQDVDIAGKMTHEFMDRVRDVALPFRGADARAIAADESHIIRSTFYGIPGTQAEIDACAGSIIKPEGAQLVALDPGSVTPMVATVDNQLSWLNFRSILEGFDLLVALSPDKREVIFTANGDMEKMFRVAAEDIAHERKSYEDGVIKNCSGNTCNLPIFISASRDTKDYREQTKVGPAPYYCKGCKSGR